MAARSTSKILLAAAAIALVGITQSGTALAQTNPLKLIKGTITDGKSGKPVDGGKLNVYQGTSTETVSSSKINPRTGFYQLILSPNTEYRFEVVSRRFYRTSITVKTPPGQNYEETVRDLKVDPIPMGTVIYSGRPFEPGSATISDNPALRSAAEALKREEAVVVTVTVIPEAGTAKKAAPAKKPKKGKKGSVETPTVPVASTPDPSASLGDARVTAIKNYFKGQGISTTRLMWDVRPVASAPKGKGPDNVVIRITSIQDDEDDS